MESPRTLTTIRANLVRLYKCGMFEDMLTYTRIIQRQLCLHDWIAVRQSMQHKLNGRRS